MHWHYQWPRGGRSSLYLCTMALSKDKYGLLSQWVIMLAFLECAWGMYDGDITSPSCLNLLPERVLRWKKAPKKIVSAGWWEQLPKYKVGIHNSGLRCVLTSETRQPCYLSRANMERFKWKMNSNYTVHRLRYQSTISLLKVTWKQDEELWRGKAMFADRRWGRILSDEWEQMTRDKSIWVKPDISVWASANNGSCTSNIDSKIEHWFKRKFAYVIWTSAYLLNWPSWL